MFENSIEDTGSNLLNDGWYQKLATVVLATGGVVATQNTASGEIIYTDVSSDGIVTTGTSGQQSIYFSLFTTPGAKGQAMLGGYSTNPFGGGAEATPAWTQFTLGRFGNFGAFWAEQLENGALGEMVLGNPPYPGPYPSPFNLTFGDTIGAGGNFLSGPAGYIQTVANSSDPNLDGAFGNFTIPGSGYLGLRFSPDGGANYYYGWAEIALPGAMPATPANIQLLGFAYETQLNTSIKAGAIPEPASTALLVMGAAGLAGYRRLRKQKEAARETSTT